MLVSGLDPEKPDVVTLESMISMGTDALKRDPFSPKIEGLSYGKARIVSRTVEFVPLTVPYVVEGKKRKGFYFDFGRVYWNKPEGYTYKRDRTWQFNNLKPRTYK